MEVLVKAFIFILSLAGSSIAGASPSAASFAANEIGSCGVSLPGLFASKAFFSYETLPSPEFIDENPRPELCGDAVARLEGVKTRNAEESVLLGAASAGWLSTTLKVYLDKDNKGRLGGLDVQNPGVVSDTEILAIMTAQRSFLKWAPLLKERPDFAEIATTIRKACAAHAACDLAADDRSPEAVQLSRDLLQSLIAP